MYTYIGGWGCESVVRPPLTGKSISVSFAFAFAVRACVRSCVGRVNLSGTAAGPAVPPAPRGPL